MPKVGEIYHRYMLRCRMANAVDFDDMLYYTYFLLLRSAAQSLNGACGRRKPRRERAISPNDNDRSDRRHAYASA